MDEKTRLIQADFDRLAPFEGDGWTHNRHYTPELLRHLPDHCRAVCEVGCGVGDLARRLAGRSDSVLALDLSPEMIRLARERSTAFRNIQYVAAEVMAYDLPPEHFDAVVSVAALHHMDAESILTKLKAALTPGGVLAILDLYRFSTPMDYLTLAIATPVNQLLEWKHQTYGQHSTEAHALWDAHAQHDAFLTLAQIRSISQRVLPGAVVRRHLLWRYSLIWKKRA